jgi:hypothetical protein
MAPIKRMACIPIGVTALLFFASWLLFANWRLTKELSRARDALHNVNRSLNAGRSSALMPPDSRTLVAAPRIVLNNWDDPIWRSARFNEAMLRVEVRYGRFFQRLKDWSPERIESLKRQFANGELALMSAALPTDSRASEAERKLASDAVLQTIHENEAELQSTLGEDDYAKLELFENNEASRQSVASIANAMRSKGMEIGGDLEESMLSAYSNAIREAAGNASSANPNLLTAEQGAELKREQTKAFGVQLLKNISGVLNDQQVTVFMETELEQRDRGQE